MPASNPIDILLAHDHWATGQLLHACESLSHEQLHRQFEMGLGSLHDTLTHIIVGKRHWVDLLAGRKLNSGGSRPYPQRTVSELSAMHKQVAEDFASQVLTLSLDQTITVVRDKGETHTYTRGCVLSHVVTHTMHHRAQCLNMLRHLGIKPLPAQSVIEWYRFINAQP